MNNAGKYIFMAGIMITGIGLIIWLAGNKFGWFGRLPGDITFKREGFSFYMPLASMLLLSVVLSLVIYIIRKIF
jgi:hypothetical protein